MLAASATKTEPRMCCPCALCLVTGPCSLGEGGGAIRLCLLQQLQDWDDPSSATLTPSVLPMPGRAGHVDRMMRASGCCCFIRKKIVT